MQTLSRFNGLYQAVENQRVREEQEVYTDLARARAAKLQSVMTAPTPSNLLGNGRLGDVADAAALDLTNNEGLYLGWVDGCVLSYPSDGHLLTYGRARSGKGRDCILPNLAFTRGRSLVVIDPKDGELAYASRHFRAEADGQEPLYLNPYGVQGLPNTRINPLKTLLDAIERGDEVDGAARDIARILVPETPKSGDNWVTLGARRLIALRAEYLARVSPDDCTLATIWDFLNCDETAHQAHLAMMAASTYPGIAGRAGSQFGALTAAPKQYQAYWQEAIEALQTFEPHSALDRATGCHDFDIARLKREPRTVYLILPADKIDDAAPWLSLIINHMIETLARSKGPLRCTFIMDEFPQLKPMPAVKRALRLYAGLNIQLHCFAQSRYAIEDVWGRAFAKELEDQASVLQVLNCDDPQFIRDVELWSGFTTVMVPGINHGGGVVETANHNMAEQKRAVLQPEDIRGLKPNELLLRIAPCPHLFIAQRYPYFEMEPFNDRIKDVRAHHTGVADDA